MYYDIHAQLSTPIGNNTLTFEERKKIGSDTVLDIPPLKVGSWKDIQFVKEGVCYEYVDEKGKLISSYGLQSLIHMDYHGKDVFIIDNHNHAFAMRWRSYLSGRVERGSYLLHVDQHSDLSEMKEVDKTQQITQESSLVDIDIYTNEVLNIASFIKPAKEIGLIRDYEMILTEYKLLHMNLDIQQPLILDIDLDFRAPEMSIAQYDQSIHRVRQLISLPQVGCITIATSPTYIDQDTIPCLLQDLLED